MRDVEVEADLRGQRLVTLALQLGDDRGQALGAALQNILDELLLFHTDDLGDVVAPLQDLRIRPFHRVRDAGDDLVQEWPGLLCFEHEVAAPDQLAQDVTPAVVRWQDPVADAEGHGAAVVRQEAQRTHIRLADGLLYRGHDRRKDVGLKVRQDALQDRAHPLQSHARVDVLLGQRRELSALQAVELREDEVPNLDVRGVGAPVIDLRAWAAGAVGTVLDGVRRPEILFGPELFYLVGGHADLVLPDIQRLGVVLVDRDPQVLGVDLEDGRHVLPGPLDGLLLKVVAEGEIAQHLKERMVVGGGPDLVQVAGAETLLAARGPHHVRLPAEEVVLELVHPRRGEEHGRVVRGHERVARHTGVPLGGEEIEEAVP